jgi:6-phosphofructokinase 1
MPLFAARLGAAAVDELLKGKSDVMVGLIANRVQTSPLEYAWTKKNPLDLALYDLVTSVAV